MYYKSDLLNLNNSLDVRENSHTNMLIKIIVSDLDPEFCSLDCLIEKALTEANLFMLHRLYTDLKFNPKKVK